jgi:Protein of unknown function (DUF1269)
MEKEYLVELGDAVVAVKDAGGRLKLNQLFQPAARGAVPAKFWGSLIGLLFMTPLADPAIGAASGALSRAADRVRHQRRVREAGRENPAIRQRRSISADPEHDHRQGARGTAWRRRHGAAQLIRRD